MPFARKQFSFADFDFMSGTASVDASPISFVNEDLVSLSSVDFDLEPLPRSGFDKNREEEIPTITSCSEGVRISDIKRGICGHYTRPAPAQPLPPKITCNVLIQFHRNQPVKYNNRRRSSKSSLVEQGSPSSTLYSIEEEDEEEEEEEIDEDEYPKCDIKIIVTDTDQRIEIFKSRLFDFEEKTLQVSEPISSEVDIMRCNLLKASMNQKPETKCLYNWSRYLQVPSIHDRHLNIRYNGNQCQACLDYHVSRMEKLRKVIEECNANMALKLEAKLQRQRREAKWDRRVVAGVRRASVKARM
jgi:hypothetical protein